MFFLTAGRMREEARRHLPALGALLDAAVAAPDPDGRRRARGYADASRRSPSITASWRRPPACAWSPATFGWNDVGSWAALTALRAPDARGNVVLGDARR